MIQFGESGHPVFRATSPLFRGTLKITIFGKLSILFCSDEGTIETVFRKLISDNQSSVSTGQCGTCVKKTKPSETRFGKTM